MLQRWAGPQNGNRRISSFPELFLSGLLLDALFGDPQIRLHPIRLMGDVLLALEKLLRSLRIDGYLGGCLLFVGLAVAWVVTPSALVSWLSSWNSRAGIVAHVFVVYSMFALRDLVDHVREVQRAARREDLPAARSALALFVGRDTRELDFAQCRRAAIESLSESFVDGVIGAVFWYLIAGLPGLLLFKLVSTMDSMVGYKTPRYLKFGWCGARLDDLMNYLPARLSWVLLGLSAIPFPGLSALKGWRIGIAQHAVVPGPNPGWSEATMAGVLQRRLIGPIWKNGTLVTSMWLGDPSDPEAGTDADVTQALRVVLAASVLAAGTAVAILWL